MAKIVLKVRERLPGLPFDWPNFSRKCEVYPTFFLASPSRGSCSMVFQTCDLDGLHFFGLLLVKRNVKLNDFNMTVAASPPD